MSIAEIFRRVINGNKSALNEFIPIFSKAEEERDDKTFKEYQSQYENNSQQIKKLDSSISKCLLQAKLASSWLILYHLNNSCIKPSIDQEELHNAMKEYRRTIIHKGFKILDNKNRSSIITNYAIILDEIGRFVEALKYFRIASSICSDNYRARGNMSICIYLIVTHTYKNEYKGKMINNAYELIDNAIKDMEGKEDIPIKFHEVQEKLRHLYNEKLPIPKEFTVPKLEADIYKLWSVKNILYLNSVNDVALLPSVAHDCLTPPSTKSKEYLGMYCDQISSEYIYSRFILFRSFQKYYSKHYSEEDIFCRNKILNNNYEAIKTSFRIAYGLFDKIAYVINYYYSLGIKNNKINFSSVWYKNKKKKSLHNPFIDTNNRPLIGLYSLSKDIYDKDLEYCIEPEAKEIAELRNTIEHRFLYDTDDQYTLTEDITEELLYTKTLNLLYKVRCAIMYLYMAIHQEEEKREST